MNKIRNRTLAWGMGLVAAAMFITASVVGAEDQAENPRPRQARTSGNTWCGPLTRLGNDPVYAVYGELARYMDSGATVVGYSESDSGAETFVLCGPIRGRRVE